MFMPMLTRTPTWIIPVIAILFFPFEAHADEHRIMKLNSPATHTQHTGVIDTTIQSQG